MIPRKLFKDLTREQINYVVEGLSLLLDEKFDSGRAVTELGGLWALKRAADARLVALDTAPLEEPPEPGTHPGAQPGLQPGPIRRDFPELPEAWKPKPSEGSE